MKRAKRIVAAAAFAVILAIPSPALAFHHAAVPDCAAPQAGENAGNNPTARQQQEQKNPVFDPPLPPFGTPGNEATPSGCPAPSK